MDKQIIIYEVVKEMRKTLGKNMPANEADRRIEVLANLLELINDL